RAEDGIRDATVTGVQTCALPISDLARAARLPRAAAALRRLRRDRPLPFEPRLKRLIRCQSRDWHRIRLCRRFGFAPCPKGPVPRSEERRVGKECRGP